MISPGGVVSYLWGSKGKIYLSSEGIFAPRFRHRKLREKIGKIYDVLMTIFFTIANFFLILTHTQIYALGFTAGIICDEAADKSVEKIKHVFWKKGLIVKLLVVGGGFLAFPVTPLIVTFLCAAKVGSIASQHEDEKEKPKK